MSNEKILKKLNKSIKKGQIERIQSFAMNSSPDFLFIHGVGIPSKSDLYNLKNKKLVKKLSKIFKRKVQITEKNGEYFQIIVDKKSSI